MNSMPRFGNARLLLAILVLVMLAMVYAGPIRDILQLSVSSPDHGYILIAPAVAAYLAWLRRSRMASIQFKTSYWGSVIILLSWIAFWVGGTFSIQVLWHASFLIGFTGLLVTVFGLKILRSFGPAIFVLFALVPLPFAIRQAITIPLQDIATWTTAFFLDVLGIDVVRRGVALEVNGVVILVGEACNGMRLFMPLLVVLCGLVFSLPLFLRTRILLLCVSLPVALICNALRLVPTAVAYAYFPSMGEQVHDFSGILMLPLAILLLMFFLSLLEWLDVPPSRWRLFTAS